VRQLTTVRLVPPGARTESYAQGKFLPLGLSRNLMASEAAVPKRGAGRPTQTPGGRWDPTRRTRRGWGDHIDASITRRSGPRRDRRRTTGPYSAREYAGIGPRRPPRPPRTPLAYHAAVSGRPGYPVTLAHDIVPVSPATNPPLGFRAAGSFGGMSYTWLAATLPDTVNTYVVPVPLTSAVIERLLVPNCHVAGKKSLLIITVPSNVMVTSVAPLAVTSVTETLGGMTGFDLSFERVSRRRCCFVRIMIYSPKRV